MNDIPRHAEIPEAEVARAVARAARDRHRRAGPGCYVNAWWDWYLNLAKHPPKQLEILQDAWASALDTWNFALKAATGEPLAPAEGDARFADDAWSQWPFNVYARGYRNYADWWQKAWSGVPGRRTRERTHARLRGPQRARGRLARQLSRHQSGAAGSHPRRGRAESGARLQQLARGRQAHARRQGDRGTEKFVVGRDVAATPGKVVLRNELIELIQYAPAHRDVFAEPILIVPAWIMKYYILDLSAGNSLVRYLVSQGHTVFMVSWKNPNASDRNLGMDDYLRLGIRIRVDAVSTHRAGPEDACRRLLHRRHAAVDRRRGAARRDGDRPAGEHDVCWRRSRISASPASSRCSSARVSSTCSRRSWSAPACSRANRWARPSRCCARAICCGRRRSTPTCAASATRRTI